MGYKVIEALIEADDSEDIVDSTYYDNLSDARSHYIRVIKKYLKAEGYREIDIQIAVGRACEACVRGIKYTITCLDMRVYIEQ